ncbi:hypothetical protein [Luteimonas sp. 3794]|uniref:hypothetical protein n=1 Tax=Luteimonas sp. 3794 TaxID=2817730 RepID=UPI002864766A|nr:hypothetical protein [Luteimonas sp. 3794]MDR6993217.1 hypothetical protein [Luteimonas sp. 3794]
MALLLSGCGTLGGGTRERELQRPPFPVDEYAQLSRRAGHGGVHGQVIMRTEFGPRFGAGETVTLNPVTSYSTFWYENQVVGKRRLVESDPRLSAHIISTTADGSGTFQFDRVPAGDYYLTSTVRWSEPGYYVGTIDTRQRLLVQRVTVSNGGNLRHILTN